MNRLRDLGQKDINEGEIWKVFFLVYIRCKYWYYIHFQCTYKCSVSCILLYLFVINTFV